MKGDHDRTIKIYHSCDPDEAPILLHFKAGRYTLYHPQLDPHAFAPLVRIPKRKGTTEQVRRCLKARCDTCANTDIFTDLTLDVAMSHGIRRAALKPSAKAKTVAEKLADGAVRGRWIYGDLKPDELVGEVLREPKHHRYPDESEQVFPWLARIPLGTERADSAPPLSVDLNAKSQENSLPPEDIAQRDNNALAVGADFSCFSVRSSKPEVLPADAAEDQTQARTAVERDFIGVAPQKTLPTPLRGNTPWNYRVSANPMPPRPLHIQAPVLPQTHFGVCKGRDSAAHRHNPFQRINKAPLTRLPRDTETPTPSGPPLVVSHQAHGSAPKVTMPGNACTGPPDCTCPQHAKAYRSPRHTFQPEQLPSPPYARFRPGDPINSSEWRTLLPYQGTDHPAAVAPPQLGYTFRQEPSPRISRTRVQTPGGGDKAVDSAASVGMKRVCEDAGLVVQERRKRGCRVR